MKLQDTLSRPVPFVAMVMGCVFVLAGVALAQDSPPRVEAELGQDEIFEGQAVAYRVTVSNVENPPTPDLSNLADFAVRSLGQHSIDSQQISVINGRMTKIVRRGQVFDYQLFPRKTGELTISSPTVKVAGKAVTGPVLKLRVTPAAEQDTLVMELSVDHPKVYPMQPFSIALSVLVHGLPRRYSARDPVSLQSSPPILEIPWLPDEKLPPGVKPAQEWKKWLSPFQDVEGRGFSINRFSSGAVLSFFGEGSRYWGFHPKPKQVIRKDKNGEEASYWQYDFPRTFLAKKPGAYSFGPVTLQGTFAVGTDSQDRLQGKEIYAMAKPVEITISDVPRQDRPEAYAGLVGKFRVSARLQPDRVKVGDPMTLTLSIEGEGSLDSAVAPDLTRIPAIAERFKVYDASQETKDRHCQFSYSLRPLREGQEPFPAVPVAYFDVDQERFVTLQTDPIAITVTRADKLSGSQIVAAPGKGLPGKELESRREGIFANVADLSALRDESVRPGHWLAGLGAMMAVYAMVAVAVGRWRRVHGDVSLLRRRRAPARAYQRLREGLDQLASGQERQGAELLHAALVGLVADHADLPEAGLTPKEVFTHLTKRSVEECLAGRVAEFLEQCDAARYGAMPAGSDSLEGQAPRLLDELIRAFRTANKTTSASGSRA